MNRSALVALVSVACIPELPTLDDPCGDWPDPGLYRTVEHPDDSGTRRPYVYVPDSTGPRDIVFVLHGAGMTGPKMVEVTGYLDAADALGFVVVYPNGLGFPLRDWNAGPAWGGPDDVAFLESVAKDVSDKVCGRRILATGFSNGAMMGHRWACEGTMVDVLGVSSGPLMVDSCEGEPVPVRHYHGTADTTVPMDGGVGTPGRGISFTSVDDTMALWRERNRCSDAAPEFEQRGDTNCRRWDCEAATELCLVDGWGHMWPGGIHSAGTDADATGALLEFLDQADPLTEATSPTATN
ncbi:MAG: hypothetical protein H6738_02000 [Alphaproteobacteria bacterium]|nr:hypothetical protein [Alphaproteobacteria bacterium]MCB9695541.1 hypothetical protein [Alphaproteobacteria bacterium]